LGGTALVPGTGHFSESWAVETEALGRRVVRTPWREGFPIDVEAVAQALRDDRERAITAIFVVHTDTASSVTTDLTALRAAIDDTGHPALFVVDVVASLGAAPFDMDGLRVDVAVGASQKGLMCPPGVGIVAVGAAARELAARNPAPRYYWDWRLREAELSYRKFCGTPPLNLIFGLEAALGLIFDEGEEQVFARHRLLARAVHAAVQGWASEGELGLFVRVPECRSVSVTTIALPAGVDVEELRTTARERFQVAVAGGLGPLTGRAFRIGHLGDQNPAQLLGALGGVQAALRVLGIAHGDGMRAAVDCLAAGV
jgi:alanine-glyoxylate transaminase/serine-glyoxylate transaminase/serine-pyruvate transaminase